MGKVLSYNAAIATVDITGFHIVSLTPQVGLQKALATLQEGYKEAAVAGLGLWLPMMSVIYTFVPVHLRSTQFSLAFTLKPANLTLTPILTLPQHEPQP